MMTFNYLMKFIVNDERVNFETMRKMYNEEHNSRNNSSAITKFFLNI